MEPLDNHLTIDEEWETFEKDEDDDSWERFCYLADLEYDSRFDFEEGRK